MLLLAPGHPIKFTQLLYELMHGEHSGCQRLRFIIDILSTLNDLIIQDLIRIYEVSHL